MDELEKVLNKFDRFTQDVVNELLAYTDKREGLLPPNTYCYGYVNCKAHCQKKMVCAAINKVYEELGYEKPFFLPQELDVNELRSMAEALLTYEYNLFKSTGKYRYIRGYVAHLLALEHGLSISELCSLTWDTLAYFKLSERLKEAVIMLHVFTVGDEYVICKKNGRPFDLDTLKCIYQGYEVHPKLQLEDFGRCFYTFVNP